MPIFDGLDPKNQKEIYKKSLKEGDVFLGDFVEASHKKYFIIVAISEEKVFICSVFINSEIHLAIKNKPKIYSLQIPLLKTRNNFLKYDSYANCSYPIISKTNTIVERIINKTCKVIGNIHTDDLKFIQDALINSGLLTQEQIELFFKK